LVPSLAWFLNQSPRAGASLGKKVVMRLKLPLVAEALAAGLVIAAVLVPASAAGSTSARVKMAIVPLPKSSIGSVVRPLPLSHFSGVVSNAAAADQSMSGTAKMFQKLGRVSGYRLDYGVAASGGSGVTAVLTGVEQYKTTTAAKRGLAFWKADDSLLRRLLNHGSLGVKNNVLKVRAVGQARFAYLTSYMAANIVPFSTVDERVLEGKYVLQVQVSAGTAAAAKALAPKLAAKLDARLKLALKGRLHAVPVKLPPKQTAGPPTDGPDLSALALKTSDFTEPATLAGQGYSVDKGMISCFDVAMSPAGSFDLLGQEVQWYATANQAAFEADWRNALFLSAGNLHRFSQMSIGHGLQGAWGFIGKSAGGMFTLTVGRLDVFVLVVDKSTVSPGDLMTLAQTLAIRLDTVYTG
jgi:hypothetical protein